MYHYAVSQYMHPEKLVVSKIDYLAQRVERGLNNFGPRKHVHVA